MTDTERLDFLSQCVWENGHSISAERHYNSYTGDYDDEVELFTVPSQWVTAEGDLRAAIDAAMERAKK